PTDGVVRQDADPMAVVMNLAHGVKRAAIVFFDIELVARELGPAGIDQLGRSDGDLGDEVQIGLRSLRRMARIGCARLSLSKSITRRSSRCPRSGYSRSVPAPLS